MCVVPATVTDRSCIASSKADCVLGVARLISSASTRLANTGPRWKSNRRPPSGVSCSTFVPIRSAGIRSGVNWIRWNFRCSASARVRTSRVLPRPGTPSSSTWPPAIRAVSVSSTISRWPTMTLPISRRSASKSERNRSSCCFNSSGVCESLMRGSSNSWGAQVCLRVGRGSLDHAVPHYCIQRHSRCRRPRLADSGVCDFCKINPNEFGTQTKRSGDERIAQDVRHLARALKEAWGDVSVS